NAPAFYDMLRLCSVYYALATQLLPDPLASSTRTRAWEHLIEALNWTIPGMRRPYAPEVKPRSIDLGMAAVRRQLYNIVRQMFAEGDATGYHELVRRWRQAEASILDR